MCKAALQSLILSVVCAVAIAANDDQSSAVCTDNWHGFIDASVNEFSVSLSLRRLDANRCEGSIDIPERDVLNAPIRNLTINNELVTFATTARGVELVFKGKLTDGNSRIDGLVQQGVYNLPFKLARGSATLARPEVEPTQIALRNAEGLPSERASIAPPEHAAIRYASEPTTDVVAKLNRDIAAGLVQLKFEDTQGYLRATLDALKVSSNSQMLVFSKTSVQAHLISPSNPRALFFRDDVTVGFIPNAPLIELAAVDPKQGVIFYTLDQKESASPRFVRRDNCLSCHLSHNTMAVPGLRLRSVITGPTGRTFDHFGDYRVDDRTPFNERWGGWYVTGTAKNAAHLGNAMLTDSNNPESLLNSMSNSVASINGRFPADAFPSATSDIAALMVYEHQAQMTNLLVRVSWDARAARQLKDNAFNRELIAKLLANNAAELVDYLLFVDEAALPGAVVPSSAFASEFSAIGPRDRNGRTLRELELGKRLMRYPCSYMIYSDAFMALPSEAKSAIYARMWKILSGADKNPKYQRLSTSDRRAVIEILRETKDDLPPYFK